MKFKGYEDSVLRAQLHDRFTVVYRIASTVAPEEQDALSMAKNIAVDMGQLSTTALQRRLKLGYAKAARIVDELEQRGIVGPSEGARPRKVLMSPQELTEWKLRVAAKGNQVSSTGM